MPKDNSEQIKGMIIQLLEKHPEGLTLEDLSRIIHMHRQTVTKYILELKGAEVVYRRWVGSASLNYLKGKFGKSE